jgi:hypothetical protein
MSFDHLDGPGARLPRILEVQPLASTAGQAQQCGLLQSSQWIGAVPLCPANFARPAVVPRLGPGGSAHWRLQRPCCCREACRASGAGQAAHVLVIQYGCSMAGVVEVSQIF